MTPQHLTLAIVLAAGAVSPLAAQTAVSRKIDRALHEALADGCRREAVIIQARPGYRAGLVRVLEAHGDTVTAEHPLIEAVAAEVHCDDLDALDGFDEVIAISKDAVVRAYDRRPDDAGGVQGDARQRERRTSSIRRPQRGGGTPASQRRDDDDRVEARSSGIGVAIVDSGIEPGPQFGARLTHFYDFTSGRARQAKASDAYGHGTHIAGLIAGRTIGVAPQARLVGLKVLNGNGEGRTSHVVRALEFATANREALGIRAINVSLGHPIYEPAATDPLVQAIEAAVRTGLVVITAAGNHGQHPETGETGYAGVMSPGNAPSALTVGAVRTFDTAARADDRVADYSSRGPTWYDAFAKPDVVAPGDHMWSVAPRRSELRKFYEQYDGYTYGDYLCLSGTSMAAGYTSGLAALLLQHNPGLTPNALKMVLQFTAIPVRTATGAAADPLTQGAGGVNRDGALLLARAIDARVPVGGKWLTYGMPFETAIAGERVAWSQSMIWGPHRVVGDGIVDENRPAWSTSVVWGDGVSDDGIAWGLDFTVGDNIVWGTAHDAGDNLAWGTNFLWSREVGDNIVWGTAFEDASVLWGRNIVWGTALLGLDTGFNIVWGTTRDYFNIVWGTATPDDVVWGSLLERNIVWGTLQKVDSGFNIVWGTALK